MNDQHQSVLRIEEHHTPYSPVLRIKLGRKSISIENVRGPCWSVGGPNIVLVLVVLSANNEIISVLDHQPSDRWLALPWPSHKHFLSPPSRTFLSVGVKCGDGDGNISSF